MNSPFKESIAVWHTYIYIHKYPNTSNIIILTDHKQMYVAFVII